MDLAAAAVLVLAAAGFLDALYFTLVTYRRIPPDPRWLPPFCRMDEAACARVVDTRWARLFGVPNSVLGLAWYVAAGSAAAYALATGRFPLCGALLGGAVLAFATSLVLAWALLFRLRTPCPLCFFGHAVNASLLVLLAVACLP